VPDYDDVYQMEEYDRQQVQSLQRTRDYRKFARSVTYQPFFQRVRHTPGARVLDVGCGVGRFCLAAAACGWDVTGIDISERAIKIAQQFATFPVHACTLESMIGQGQVFDAATAFEVLEHLADPVGFLRQVQRVLRPRGDVLCTVPNWDYEPLHSTTKRDWIPPIHLGFFTLRALQTAGEQAGLQDAQAGIIWSDPFPAGQGPLRPLRWLLRRLRRKPNLPVGLWLHGRAPAG
jgi:2-polyprenyl-3-methyl-5-hydroxy-6-metoxy-1,4-benzoquinol methylase